MNVQLKKERKNEGAFSQVVKMIFSILPNVIKKSFNCFEN